MDLSAKIVPYYFLKKRLIRCSEYISGSDNHSKLTQLTLSRVKDKHDPYKLEAIASKKDLQITKSNACD